MSVFLNISLFPFQWRPMNCTSYKHVYRQPPPVIEMHFPGKLARHKSDSDILCTSRKEIRRQKCHGPDSDELHHNPSRRKPEERRRISALISLLLKIHPKYLKVIFIHPKFTHVKDKHVITAEAPLVRCSLLFFALCLWHE